MILSVTWLNYMAVVRGTRLLFFFVVTLSFISALIAEWLCFAAELFCIRCQFFSYSAL